MKPRELILEAFGPFSGNEAISFDKLNNGLYLITGATGSGKTTIFDGITFALYGEPSGNNRKAVMLRSDYAGESDITRVTYTFDYGNRRYKVWRTPQYERAKLRGKGTVTQSGDAALYDLSKPLDEQVIASGTSGVTEKITEIMGINREQFINVSMIAQGEFLKLLLAKSTERAEIFRNIFKTSIYESLEKELKDAVKELENKKKLKKEMLIRYAEDVSDEIKEEYRSFIEENNVYYLPDFIDGVKEHIDSDAEQLEKISQEKKQYRKEYELALGELSEAKEKERVRQETAARLEDLKRKLGLLQPRLEKTEEMLKKAEQEKENIETLKTNAIRIKDTFPLYEELDVMEKELSEKNRDINNIEREIKKNAGIISDMEKKTTLLADKLNRDTEEYNKLETEKNHVTSTYERMSDEFLRNQAGIMAAELEDGKPCPVCGSREHPQKQPLHQAVCSEEDLNAMKNKRDTLRSRQEEMSRNLKKDKESMEDVENAILPLREKEKTLADKKQDMLIGITGLKELIREKKEKLTYPDFSEAKRQYENSITEIDSIEVRQRTAKEEADSLRVEQKTVTTLITKEEEQLKNQEKQPDISESEEKMRLADVLIKNTEKREKELELIIAKNKKAVFSIEKEYGDYSLINGEWEIYDSLSRTANGAGYSKGKFNFESYVQARYFEQIIELANIRLGKMTEGRYVLMRRREALSKASHTGLEIDVLDNNTGKIRRGETLSGGEAFMAALSMALGMSDVIASNYGGIRLDSMFIDEGFGSLDSYSLEKALEILDDLSLGGNRSIGIISHVEALKDRIDNKIVVERDIKGSHVFVNAK